MRDSSAESERGRCCFLKTMNHDRQVRDKHAGQLDTHQLANRDHLRRCKLLRMAGGWTQLAAHMPPSSRDHLWIRKRLAVLEAFFL